MRAKELNLTSAGRERMVPAFPDMPLACYTNRFGADTYDYIDWHWHDQVQYCIVLAGRVLFQVGRQSYPAQQGQGIFIPAGLAHMSRPEGDGPSAYFCLDVDLDRLLAGVPGLTDREKDPGSAGQPLLLHPARARDLLRGIRAVQEAIQAPTAPPILLYSQLFHLWHLTLAHLTDAPWEESRRQHNQRLIRILSYLQEHYREKISLDQVARQVHLSRSECCRFFKHTLGQTIFDYLRQYRVQRSKELLRETQMSVAQVAYAVGFGSQSYFTMVFRQETGCTPSQYRAT